MGKTSRHGGASDRALAQVDEPTDLVGLQNFTTEPTIGDVPLRTYVSPTALAVVGALNRATSPALAVAENMPRASTVLSTQSVLTSGTLRLIHLSLVAGQVVTSLAPTSIGAAVNPTNQWFGLFDSSRVALRFTVNDLTTAWGANTRKILALTTPFTATYTGLYYAGILVTADTTPSLSSAASQSQVTGQTPILGGNTSDNALTTVPSLPFTAGAITSSGTMPHVTAF